MASPNRASLSKLMCRGIMREAIAPLLVDGSGTVKGEVVASGPWVVEREVASDPLAFSCMRSAAS